MAITTSDVDHRCSCFFFMTISDVLRERSGHSRTRRTEELIRLMPDLPGPTQAEHYVRGREAIRSARRE
jgi:hypothetical protein